MKYILSIELVFIAIATIVKGVVHIELSSQSDIINFLYLKYWQF